MGATPALINTAAASYDPGNGVRVNVQSLNTNTQPDPVLDPTAGVTACEGAVLPDFTNFSVGLYGVDALGSPTAPLKLVETQLPVLPAVALPAGIAPNNQNINPFTLSNGNKGLYEFLLDATGPQIAPGTAFLIAINVPQTSALPKRRVKVVLGTASAAGIGYTATALDGAPISANSNAVQTTGVFPVVRTSASGLFAVVQLKISECPSTVIGLSKTANVATAQVGDTVVFTVTANNLTQLPIATPFVTDTLPLGFSYVQSSARGSVSGATVPLTVAASGSRLTFTTSVQIPPASSFVVVYAIVIAPDALKGTAQNVAVIDAAINGTPIHGGPAAFALKLDPGLLSDCGTILGRVYVDFALNGLQRKDQPGLADAVVLFDDGVRVTTDKAGLYHYPGCAHPGWRSAILDLTSIPGYTMAPNIYRIDKNGRSQAAHLAPSGLIKLNFAVVPAKSGSK